MRNSPPNYNGWRPHVSLGKDAPDRRPIDRFGDIAQDCMGDGCVIVGPNNEIRAIGYNSFPKGIDNDNEARHQRPAKYSWTEHSERNAIYAAARAGIALEHCRMYVPWFPCMDCARAVVQSGISELIAWMPDHSDERWGEDFKTAQALFNEAGVRVRFLEGAQSRSK